MAPNFEVLNHEVIKPRVAQDSESSLITLEVGPICSQVVSKAVNGVKATAQPGSSAGKFQMSGIA